MPFSPPQYSPFQPRDFAVALAFWFEASQRDLPWRHEQNISDPYRILVSEIMLQQTTVAAVTPFFQRFIGSFPDVAALAGAPEEEVLAHWAGLGYYSRARNLHKAAKAVVEKHGGVFPHNFGDILALPGVGRYTAGAVASIALGQRAPIVDANVARVLSRVLGVEGDLKTSKNQARLWEGATQIVEVEEISPREINPAMMELGALICTPKNPSCDLCPVASWCYARDRGMQNEIPFIAPKAQPTPLSDVCAFAQNSEGQVLMRRRPDNAIWWQGMWELPRTTRQEGESSDAALQRLALEIGLKMQVGEELAVLKHGVTRYAITLTCFEAQVETPAPSEAIRWCSFEEARTLPLPATMKTLLKTLEKRPARQLRLL